MSANQNPSTIVPEFASSRWGAFGSVAFTVIWTASVLSNVGTAMFDTASGWLITSLDANPMIVSLVQVAVSLPLFLFTLPSGALADVIDSRRLLIAVELAILAISVIFAGLVSLNLATPPLLLATTFMLGVGGALTSPAWGATTPLLVPREELDSATALNGVGFNVGRAAGPALGGLVIAALGIAVPFWIFAASNVVIVAALVWWRKPQKAAEGLPAERLVSAVRAGIRHVGEQSVFARDTDARASVLSLCQRVSGATAAPGAPSDIGGAPSLRHSSRRNRGRRRWGVAGADMAEGRTRSGPPRSRGIGRCRIRARPVRVRARAYYGDLRMSPRRRVMDRGDNEALCFGAGRAAGLGARPRARGIPEFHLWSNNCRQRRLGKLSAMAGLPIAYFVAAAGVVLGVPLAWRWKLQAGVGIDLSPAAHWRAPTVGRKVENNQGPVLAVVEYRVEATNRAEFLGTVDELGHARRRDGAYAWGVYEDVADVGRFIETFTIDSGSS